MDAISVVSKTFAQPSQEICLFLISSVDRVGTKSSKLDIKLIITIQSLIRVAHVQQNFKTTNVEESYL